MLQFFSLAALIALFLWAISGVWTFEWYAIWFIISLVVLGAIENCQSKK